MKNGDKVWVVETLDTVRQAKVLRDDLAHEQTVLVTQKGVQEGRTDNGTYVFRHNVFSDEAAALRALADQLSEEWKELNDAADAVMRKLDRARDRLAELAKPKPSEDVPEFKISVLGDTVIFDCNADGALTEDLMKVLKKFVGLPTTAQNMALANAYVANRLEYLAQRRQLLKVGDGTYPHGIWRLIPFAP